MDTVTLTIDGREVTVPKGTTVLQAAIASGIQVPYYCYHPGIGIEGSCRVCIVRVEKMGKLQTSCSTTVADGMVVHTQSDEVIAARSGVFELLLANHPLDCPVCDKGGECPLQDYSYSFGPDQSRMEFPRRVFDGEGARGDIDFGPTLMLNRQRCIMCTRCIRFMEVVDGDAQIGVAHRGYHSEIATFNDEGVHSPLSGNLADVCPVGAITAKDYRFKSRPWDNPNVVDTICTQCSKGCNTNAWLKAKPEWAKASQLVRITPRHNEAVNSYWMCDTGRYGFHWVEGETRLTAPHVRTAGALQEVPWADALRAAAAALTGTARVLVSAHASHEELFLARQIAEALGGASDVVSVGWRTSTKQQSPTTTFRLPAVDAPNVNGARAFGFVAGQVSDPQGPADLSALRAAVDAGRVAALFVLDPGPAGSVGDTQWIVDARQTGRLGTLVVQAPVRSALTDAADVVLPGAAFIEKDACYTNDQGRLQATSAALVPPGDARDDWRVLSELAQALGRDARYTSDHDVRAAIAAQYASAPALLGIATIAFSRPMSAETWLESSNPSERYKWETLYQDLPPVKGSVDPSALPAAPGVIRLQEVK